jgi:preprotein translocase subunit SecE
MKTFITGLRSEFSKIVWPDTGTAFGHAALVIVIALVVGYYLGLLDAVFAYALRVIIG